MPKKYCDINLSPFAESEQQQVFGDFTNLLGQCNVDHDRCWTCFAWKLGVKAGRRRGRIYFGRDELVLMLDDAVQWLRAQGYWWPMIGFVVESPRKPGKRRDGRWHVHIVEIADRLPSRAQRELIREALRRAGFSDVRLDDLTLSSSDLAWWEPREEAKANGHEGFGDYAAKNAAEHDSETPFAVYRTPNVPGPALPGEEVTREILRAARSSAPKADAPSPRRPVARASVQRVPRDRRAAQAAPKTTGGLSLPSPLFQPPPSAPKPRPPAPQVVTKSTAGRDSRTRGGRRSFTEMRLESVKPGSRPFTDGIGRARPGHRWSHAFEAPGGQQFRWSSSRELVVEAPDGKLYTMEPGLRWNFAATPKIPLLPKRENLPKHIKLVWSPGSGRRKVWLLHQPEVTRRACREVQHPTA